jgi:hypothetical protein
LTYLAHGLLWVLVEEQRLNLAELLYSLYTLQDLYMLHQHESDKSTLIDAVHEADCTFSELLQYVRDDELHYFIAAYSNNGSDDLIALLLEESDTVTASSPLVRWLHDFGQLEDAVTYVWQELEGSDMARSIFSNNMGLDDEPVSNESEEYGEDDDDEEEVEEVEVVEEDEEEENGDDA